MNKSALIKLIAEKADVSQKEASKALQVFLDAVMPKRVEPQNNQLDHDSIKQQAFKGRQGTRTARECYYRNAVRQSLKNQYKKQS